MLGQKPKQVGRRTEERGTDLETLGSQRGRHEDQGSPCLQWADPFFTSPYNIPHITPQPHCTHQIHHHKHHTPHNHTEHHADTRAATQIRIRCPGKVETGPFRLLADPLLPTDTILKEDVESEGCSIRVGAKLVTYSACRDPISTYKTGS